MSQGHDSHNLSRVQQFFWHDVKGINEKIKALIYKMATNDSKGTILSFWGNVNTVNVLGNQESDTTIDDNGHLKESIEIHEISENDQNGQPLPHIDEDIKSFFE